MAGCGGSTQTSPKVTTCGTPYTFSAPGHAAIESGSCAGLISPTSLTIRRGQRLSVEIRTSKTAAWTFRYRGLQRVRSRSFRSPAPRSRTRRRRPAPRGWWPATRSSAQRWIRESEAAPRWWSTSSLEDRLLLWGYTQQRRNGRTLDRVTDCCRPKRQSALERVAGLDAGARVESTPLREDTRCTGLDTDRPETTRRQFGLTNILLSI